MNTQTEKPLSTHIAERTLYKVEVRQHYVGPRQFTLNGKSIGNEWEAYHPAPRHYNLNEHVDTVAELDDGLFPFVMAMAEAYWVLGVEHARAFEVRLVPHVVKTSYASYPQEPMEKLDRNPA